MNNYDNIYYTKRPISQNGYLHPEWPCILFSNIVNMFLSCFCIPIRKEQKPDPDITETDINKYNLECHNTSPEYDVAIINESVTKIYPDFLE